MPSTDLLLAFLAAATIFAYMPGPAMLYTAAQTAARGRKAGFMASLGIHIGGYVHVVAAATGLSALFEVVPALYIAIKTIGAAYLVWLGLRMISRAMKAGSTKVSPRTGPAKSIRRAFLESIVVEMLNPKAAVFFLAFLPQFVEPSGSVPVWLQFLILGTIVNAMFSTADLFCVLFSNAVIERFRKSSSATKVMECIGGSMLVGLGAHLALQRIR